MENLPIYCDTCKSKFVPSIESQTTCNACLIKPTRNTKTIQSYNMKTCEHKGCTKQFVAAGRRRYCDDHFIGRNHQATYERNQKKSKQIKNDTKLNVKPERTTKMLLANPISAKVSIPIPANSLTFSGILIIDCNNGNKMCISGDNITISI